MTSSYIFGLRQLLEVTLEKCGLEALTEDRCAFIASVISQRTKHLISENVIKKIYGLNTTACAPPIYTLEVLALFCGSTSWTNWQEQLKQAGRVLPKHALANKDFNKVFYYSDQPMWIFETNTLRFLEVNEAACNIYGYDHGQFLNMTLFDIRPPEDNGRLIEALKTVGEYTRHQQPFRHLLARGEVVKVDIVSYNFNGYSAPARLVSPILMH